MKKRAKVLVLSSLVCLSLTIVSMAGAQETRIARADVPAPVLAAFVKSFPKAKIVGYAKEVENGKTLYEIESKEGTMTRDASFNPDGTLAVLEESLPESDLPKPVADALKKNHPKAQLVLAERVTEGKKIFYELHLKQDGKSHEAKFNPDGTVMK